MNQSDMLLQMVYSMVQSAQSTRPTQAAQTQNNGTQKSDDGKDFQTLLEEKRTELDGQTVEQPVENGEEPKDDVPADVLAQAPADRTARLELIDATAALAEEVIEQEGQLTVAKLAVNGQDLLRIGLPQGPQIGALLHRMLEQVLDGVLPNERQTLLDALEREVTKMP